jgi:hypothetical protein
MTLELLQWDSTKYPSYINQFRWNVVTWIRYGMPLSKDESIAWKTKYLFPFNNLEILPTDPAKTTSAHLTTYYCFL